ncbi:MAG TPA: hypothetical protein VGM90_35545 [Kofleriaceae bacterium]
MAKRKPLSLWLVYVIAGALIIGLNLVANEMSREGSWVNGQYWTTYWPIGIGIGCLVGGLIAKLVPKIDYRIGLALLGVAFIAANMVLDDYFAFAAKTAGKSTYWTSHLIAGFGCMMLIASVTALGRRSD